MSKSLKRVLRAFDAAGLEITPVEITDGARTAQAAADAVGCDLNQIAKSIIFRGEISGKAILFITAGGNQVCADLASGLAGELLGKADAGLIRSQTGFAIGGVSPVGHLSPIKAFFDPKLLEFDMVWAAAGTPRHVFGINPAELQRFSDAEVSDFTL